MAWLSRGGQNPPLYKPLYKILVLLGWTSLCHCLDDRDIAPVPALTTSVAAISKLATAATTTSVPPSTITSPPPWGDQVLPINTCYQTSSEGSIEYLSCTMHLGVVKISYFPDNSRNATYPSTWYNSDWSITMTSPLLYMLVETADGNNQCGSMGPTFSNKVVSMPISDALTMQPYENAAAASRMGPPRPLTLSDLADCSTLPSDLWSLIPAIMTLHPVADNFYRCNPHFVVPPEVWELGGQYWKNCVHFNNEIGIFDPPGAVPSVSGLLITEIESTAAVTQTTANTIAAARPEQPKITTSTSSTSSPTSSATPTSTSTSTSASPPPSSSTSTSTLDLPIILTPTKSSASASKFEGVSNVPDVPGSPPTPVATLVKPVLIGTIASLTISAIAGASTVIVESQTATIGGPELTLDNHFVVTAATTALMVYMPGGGVSSLAWPTAAVNNGQPEKVTPTSVGIAGIIASIMGVSPYTTATTAPTTVSSYSSSSTTNSSLSSLFSTSKISPYHTTLVEMTTSPLMIPSSSPSTLVASPPSSSFANSNTEKIQTTTSIPLGAINKPQSAWNSTLVAPTTSAGQSGPSNTAPVGNGTDRKSVDLNSLAIVLAIFGVLGISVL